MTLSEELEWRGFVNQMTFNELADINEPRTFYWGVDPSADSMTIGNLAPAMMIRHMIDHGHKAILLVGGATGMIGDPDGKKQERDLKTLDEIAKNKAAIAEQYRNVFAGQEFEIVDNYDWFKDMNYLDFLRDIGKHASMTQMLDRDFVQNRIGEGGDGISYAEFSYSLVQGYDFLHLFRTKGASLQVAGADQWGNSISGVQLIRRIEGGEAHVFTAPLIVNKQTGVKFGKSEGGAIWLDPQKTTPYKFYQFWLNVDDETAQALIKIYTLLKQDEVESVIQKHIEHPAERSLQKTLAREVTRIVHGEDRLRQVEQITKILLGEDSSETLGSDDFEALEGEIPVVQRVPTSTAGNDTADSLMVSDALERGGLAASKGNARRLMEAGAVTIDGQKVLKDHMLQKRTLIKKGKNSFVLVK